MVLDGPLGEHIRLLLKIALIIQHFQGAEQGVRGILIERQPVPGAVQDAVFLGIGVIEAVKIGLLRFDLGICRTFQLQINELSGAVPNPDHTFDAGGWNLAQLHRNHAGVLPEVNFPLGHRVAEIAYIRVCRDALNRCAILLFGCVHVQQFPVRRVDLGNRPGKLFRQVSALNGITGGFRVVAVHTFAPNHRAQHHFRVLKVILVKGYAVRGQAALYPFRQLFRHSGPLLEKQNIAGDFGSGVGLESVVGQTDRAQEVGFLCQGFPYLAVFLVHGAF